MIPLINLDHEFGQIRVYRKKQSGEIVYLQDGYYQSRCDSAGISVVTYVHALYDFVLQTKAKKVLMIGCGGGTLGYMLARTGIEVTIADVNPAAIAIAKNFFNLPATVECFPADGADYLAASTNKFDAVILDAYCGSTIPEHFCTADFFKLVRSRLCGPNGGFFANVQVADDEDEAALRFAAAAGAVWSCVRILDWPGAIYRNAIIAGGGVEALTAPTLTLKPLSLSESISRELRQLRFIDDTIQYRGEADCE